MRGLKQKLYKYYTKHRERGSFENVLRKIVTGKNNTVHSSHGFKPSEIDLNNQHLVFEALYPNFYDNKYKWIKQTLKIGDTVRLSRLQNPFSKAARRTFTDEIFVVYDVIATRVPPMYRIKSTVDNIAVEGTFYSDDLVKYNEDSSSKN